jgi:anti-repressor protein
MRRMPKTGRITSSSPTIFLTNSRSLVEITIQTILTGIVWNIYHLKFNIMNELIPISEYKGKKAVSARLLHTFLESKRDFSNWIKERIQKYDLVENQDFEVFNNFGENPSGGRPLTEYALSIDAAKELSMVEGNAKGKQARQYFIACEKKWKESKNQLDFSNPDTVLMLVQNWKEERSKRELAEKKASQMKSVADELYKNNESLKPKALFADAVATSNRSVLVSELAKILKQNGVDIGQNRLFVWLREHGYLCSKGEYYNQPSQKAMELGLFEIKKTSITRPDGSVLVTCTTKVTGKGQIYFVNKFLKHPHFEIPA